MNGTPTFVAYLPDPDDPGIADPGVAPELIEDATPPPDSGRG